MSKEKYYTPEREDFYVGFYYEIFEESKWKLRRYIPEEFSWQDLKEYINNKKIRVKYLDEENIEYFDFKKEYIPNVYKKEENDIEPGYTKNINKNISINLHYNNCHLTIYKQIIYNEITGNWYVEYLFNGKIKNKSEFKKLLKQLEIYE